MSGDSAKIKPTVPAADRLLLTVDQAADLLSVSPQTLEKLPIKRWTLPGVRAIRYRRKDLEQYVSDLAA